MAAVRGVWSTRITAAARGVRAEMTGAEAGGSDGGAEGGVGGAAPAPGALLTAAVHYSGARLDHHTNTICHLQHHHMNTLNRLHNINKKQNIDLIELRNCIDYINQHSSVIQSALRDASDSNAAVPVCSNIVKDIITVRNNIQESISNSIEIKEMLGVNYEPLMENLLKKMENQLNNWSGVLNIASKNLLNSRALMDNIQNLIVTQQQICTEVVDSELFSNLNIVEPDPTSPENDTISSEMFDKPSCFCSTPTQEQ
ncbi:uncharacterized protein LOC143919183 [Arctopsyche grandis]|uniref:uncharacterized protein LOC143919183 n=1 Tax=Arctopsyche grandis TaxID=121162 RepID=UPI00406D8E76